MMDLRPSIRHSIKTSLDRFIGSEVDIADSEAWRVEVEGILGHPLPSAGQLDAILSVAEEWRQERLALPLPEIGSRVHVLYRDPSERWGIGESGTVVDHITDYPKYDVEVDFGTELIEGDLPPFIQPGVYRRRFLFARWEVRS